MLIRQLIDRKDRIITFVICIKISRFIRQILKQPCMFVCFCIRQRELNILVNKQVQHPIMQQKKDNTGFNIRKVYKRNFSISKNPQESPVSPLQLQFQKPYNNNPLFYSNTKRQKQLILDQTVNEAILSSKIYMDLKRAYQQNRKNNNQRLDELNNDVTILKTQKNDLLMQKQRIKAEKNKIQQLIEQMTMKVDKLRDQNQHKRQHVEQFYHHEAQYFNQLLLSMKFREEYEHNIDPDQMTYEELLELEEKIGNVSKGLPEEVIEAMGKVVVEEKNCGEEEKCAVCYCNFEVGEIMTSLNPCSHQFHFDCLKTWLLKEKVCPLCKRQIQILPKDLPLSNTNLPSYPQSKHHPIPSHLT